MAEQVQLSHACQPMTDTTSWNWGLLSTGFKPSRATLCRTYIAGRFLIRQSLSLPDHIGNYNYHLSSFCLGLLKANTVLGPY